MKEIVVIYHGNCPDGFTGAWAAWKKLGDTAEYIGATYEAKLPEIAQGKTVYLIDFSYKPDLMKQLVSLNKKVIAIDHHKTAAESAALAHERRYDLTHSGAALAWQYFHSGEYIPRLVAYVEDVDLFLFKLPESHLISYFLELHPFTFEEWDEIERLLEDDVRRAEALAIGRVAEQFEDQLVRRLLETYTDKVTFEGFEILAVNAPRFFSGHIGHELVKIKPPFAIVWSERHGRKFFSLRSDGTVDVSAIAAKYGGGGHPGASGFSLPAESPLPWNRIN